MQLLHNEAVRVHVRWWGWWWCRTPFVQRGRVTAQGAGALGRIVSQSAARGQHAASRGRSGRAPAARRSRAPVAVPHVHSARAGRQPETGTAFATSTTAVADHHHHHHRRRSCHRHRVHHNGTSHLGLVTTTATGIFRVQLNGDRPSTSPFLFAILDIYAVAQVRSPFSGHVIPYDRMPL